MAEYEYGRQDDVHYKYWTPELLAELKAVEGDLPAMARIGIKIINSMPPDLHLVSGPITTGGVGTVEGNLLVFGRMIEYLANTAKLNVFSQRPFHEGLVAFHMEWAKTAKPGDYCWPILLDFYAPLFATKRFKAFHFLHDYASSVGARWEYDQATQYGYDHIMLPKELSVQLLHA